MSFDLRKFLRAVKEYELHRKFSMNELAKNLLQGLLLVVPVAATVIVVYFLFTTVDGWLGLPIPGVGFLIVVAGIIVIGRLASNVFVQGALNAVEGVLTRTPFVKLLYTSVKDLIEAFMGQKKRFDQPVIVTLGSGWHAEALGFVTRQSLEMFGLHDRVAVYFPQSYNFAGQLLIFPRSQVRPANIPSSDVMAFIVSGGVSGGMSGGITDVVEAEAGT